MDPATRNSMQDSFVEDAMSRLKRLNVLHENQLITEEDYETRKSQIVDELTGTSSSYLSKKHSTFKNSTLRNSHLAEMPINPVPETRKVKRVDVVKHEAPDWKKIREEKAEKWIYDYDTETWRTEKCKVKIDEVPFEKGGLRYVFHLQCLSDPKISWVAKMSQDMKDNLKRDIYFNDVRMQAIAKHFCNGEKGYNSYNPPKHVDFLEAFVLHLIQREGSPVCHVERFIEGEYKKYNNNVGWVSSEERNTPAAFAHFTYESSKHKLLVCDIQGVGDLYTDPQVHSSENQKAFGRGNLGQTGFENFLSTHRCNAICEYLRLPNVNKLPVQQLGTVPQETHINRRFVKTVGFNFNQGGRLQLLSENGFPSFVEEKESTRCWCNIL